MRAVAVMRAVEFSFGQRALWLDEGVRRWQRSGSRYPIGVFYLQHGCKWRQECRRKMGFQGGVGLGRRLR